MSGWVAGAIVVSAAVGAYSANKASKQAAAGAEAQGRAEMSAAQLQYEASQKALQFQKDVYGDIKPYIQESLKGYQELLKRPEAFKETPGYMFRLQEGLKAVGIPQGGRQLSGAQVRRAIQYGQDYATAEYQNALARIAGLGNLAQGAYSVGSQFASAAGQTIMAGGEALAGGQRGMGRASGAAAEARAAGTIGMGRAIGEGLYGYGMYRGYNANQGPASYYGGGQTSGYGGNVTGDMYAPAYGG